MHFFNRGSGFLGRGSGFGIRDSALFVLILSFAFGLAVSAQRGANTATWFEGARLIVGDGNTIENAAFLVEPNTLTAFQKTLTALVAERGAQGFRFDFTGPWPAYHFVNEAADGV